MKLKKIGSWNEDNKIRDPLTKVLVVFGKNGFYRYSSTGVVISLRFFGIQKRGKETGQYVPNTF